MNMYEKITQRIIERIEESEENNTMFYWIKPWTGGINYPVSYTTGKPYSGINLLVLDNGEYITYKALMDYKSKLPQEEAEKIHIKKGCHKYPICFFSKTIQKDADGNVVYEKDGVTPKSRWFLKEYYVFNIEDIEGLPTHFPVKEYEHTPTENTKELEKYIAAYVKNEKIKFDIVKNGVKAFYLPKYHKVTVPAASGFPTAYGYYETVLHELIHSSSKGLNRKTSKNFGSEDYCKEELVAEIGSQMLLNYFGIIPEKEKDLDNHIAYIKGWSDYLKDNKTEIVKAACLAEKAVHYFLETARKELDKNINQEVER